MWTDSSAPEVLVAFLDELFVRVARTVLVAADGEESEVQPHFVVHFEGQNGNLDWSPSSTDWLKTLELEWSGRAGKFSLTSKAARSVRGGMVGAPRASDAQFLCQLMESSPQHVRLCLSSA